ncbi:MAG: sel1 repeat family protein, partial [Candidatus Obscuribacterales bacterium]|nr:sel1 repeat family protein [Candidatus Obscuribacterales bacterium]
PEPYRLRHDITTTSKKPKFSFHPHFAFLTVSLLIALTVSGMVCPCQPAYCENRKNKHEKGFHKALIHLKSKHYSKAHKHLKTLADKGHAKSQTILAMMYENGVGVEKDAEKAYEYYLMAAEQGLPEAESQLGHFLLQARSTVHRDTDEALRWLRRAAMHGCLEAQYTLGGLLTEVKNSPVSHFEGIWWLKEAARRGSDQAKVALSKIPGAGKIESGSDKLQAHFKGAGQSYKSGMENLETSWKGYADIVNTVNQAASYRH